MDISDKIIVLKELDIYINEVEGLYSDMMTKMKWNDQTLVNLFFFFTT